MEVLKCMTAKEVLNLIDWLRAQGFDNDKIVDCIETVEGKRKEPEQKKSEQQ
ncbi:MAG: hypothetical protein HFH22_01695 [Ruminococcus sp.]|jgi:hypothetical protein|nr:hypothetical protein [uncultured Schaedlerella sp.]MCI8767225.1 hypothetical protein [Ruminococcus sp.]MCI9328543.1 hypothetical protein [Ruminococcus sp.]